MLWLLVTTGAAVLLVTARAVLAARPAQPAFDPMRALRVQVRLTELAAEMRSIETDANLYARAHHYLAVQGAYDALLREACELAGLTVESGAMRAGVQDDPSERLREELELSERGWTW